MSKRERICSFHYDEVNRKYGAEPYEIGDELVRCKECRHWCCHNDVDYDQSKFTYYCEVHGISLTGNDFCSYAEREGE